MSSSTAIKTLAAALLLLVAVRLLWINDFRPVIDWALRDGGNYHSAAAETETTSKATTTNYDRSNNNAEDYGSSDACASLRSRTTDSLWNEGLLGVPTNHQHRIINNVRDSLLVAPDNLRGKINDSLRNLTERVLEALPPKVLRRSVHQYATGGSYGPKMQQILDKVRSKNETVRILVFGGSPTAGSNCYRTKRMKKTGKCAWPGHLETFLNAALAVGEEKNAAAVFEVVNYAIGATDSSLAVTIMTHGLIPESMKGPGREVDVVIYAYGVNDFHRYGTDDTSFLHRFLLATVRLAKCGGLPPIPLFLDDLVVGGTVPSVESYHANFVEFAQWHDVPLVGYSSVVKNALMRNVLEEKLLVDWKTDSLHMPRGGHVAVVLTLAYNFLHAVRQHCEDTATPVVGNIAREPATTTAAAAEEQLQLDPVWLPPLHEKNRGLGSVTESWRRNAARYNEKLVDACERGRKVERCTFAWVAMRREAEHRHLTRDPNHLIAEDESSREWKYDSKWPPMNYGFKPFRERNATVHLIVPGRITSREENEYETTSSMTIDDVTIRSMSITYMKSYSNKWKDAMLRVDIAHRAGGTGDRNDDDSNDDAAAAISLLGSGDFSGYHALQTSEYYTETLAINGHRPGRDLNVTFRMTSGGTFKVIAMTFCGI